MNYPVYKYVFMSACMYKFIYVYICISALCVCVGGEGVQVLECIRFATCSFFCKYSAFAHISIHTN